MKAKSTIRKEYALVREVMKRGAMPAHDRELWYGFMQALAWVMDDNAAAPSTFDSALKKKRRK